MAGTFFGDDTSEITPFASAYDRLYGAGGNDDLSSGVLGYAYWEGGVGNDYLWSSWDAGQTFGDFYGGSGNDLIQGGATNVGDFIYGGAGNDLVHQNTDYPMIGGNDYIEGGQGRDALRGERGNDTIYGGDGDDSGGLIAVGPLGAPASPGLFGGVGNDYLDGGRGKDLLVGGKGKDILVGGSQADVFDYNSPTDTLTGSKRDTILDFRRSQNDIIDLHDIDAKTGGGNQDFTFIGGANFTGVKGQLRFANEVLSADRDGNGVADMQIAMPGVSFLTGNDLIV